MSIYWSFNKQYCELWIYEQTNRAAVSFSILILIPNSKYPIYHSAFTISPYSQFTIHSSNFHFGDDGVRSTEKENEIHWLILNVVILDVFGVWSVSHFLNWIIFKIQDIPTIDWKVYSCVCVCVFPCAGKFTVFNALWCISIAYKYNIC